MTEGRPEEDAPPETSMEDLEDEDSILGDASFTDASLRGVETPDFLPPFANDENKQLNAQVRECEKRVDETSEDLEENNERISAMTDHLNSVQHEIQYTEAMFNSKKSEMVSEGHLKQLSDREDGRLKEDISKMRGKQGGLAEKLTDLQKAIYSGTEKLDQFKLLMNWNQEELEQWALAARQKEEDNLSLQRYMRADEVRIKELSLHVQKVSNSVSRKNEELEAEITETQAAQIMLDKTAEDFRQLHAERQELTRQWEEALVAMKKRDEAIQRASDTFSERKKVVKQVQSRLDASARFLESEIVNNRELNVRLAMTERQVGKLREKYGLDTSSVSEANDDVELVKATLNNTAAQLSRQQGENRALKEELESKSKLVDNLANKVEMTQQRLVDELGQLDQLQDKNKYLLNKQNEEETKLQELEREKHVLRDKIFKTGQELFQLRTTERDFIAEIAGTQSQNKNLEAKIDQLDAQISRQQELLYTADFQIQQLERKVARASGERSDDEKRQLNQRIVSLESTLEEVAHDHSMLANQVKVTSDSLGQATRTKQHLGKESHDFNSKINELKLECDTTQGAVKQSLKTKEEKLVEADVLRLEVKKRARALVEATGEVYGLENRKEQLGFSLEEQNSKAQIQKETLLAQHKIILEDIHRLTLELSEKKLKISKLAAKYDVLAGKMKSLDEPEGNDDKSQAYFVIKAAQEREELQREGDALDAEISKAEKEVAALQATMAKVMEKNVAFRNSFRNIDERQAYELSLTLKQQLDRSFDHMKLLQRQEDDLIEDVQSIQEQMSKSKLEAEDKLMRIEGRLQKEREKEAKGMNDQSEREVRASTRLTKAAKEIADESYGLANKDMQVKTIREINKTVLSELEVLAAEYPEANISDFLAAVGLSFPKGRGSRRPSDSSSRPGSRASSVTSIPARSASVSTVQFNL